jgi:3-polyprenyl-4-hydroxybenzoate decarboxylase
VHPQTIEESVDHTVGRTLDVFGFDTHRQALGTERNQ